MVAGISAGATLFCFVCGGILYLGGRDAALPKPGRGHVSVVTDDPGARVRLRQYLWLSGEPDEEPLRLEVTIRTKPHRDLRWAVLMTDDFELPAEGEASGSALPEVEPRDPEEVRAYGTSEDASFVRDAGMLPRGSSPGASMDGSVVTGSSAAPNGIVRVDLTAPTGHPLVDDNGDRYEISLPVLGYPFDGRPSQVRRYVRDGRRNPVTLAEGGRLSRSIPASIRDTLRDTRWWLPAKVTAKAEALDHDSGEQIDTASVPPESFSAWTWRDAARLEVLAIVNRPIEAAKKNRRQFLAALFLGLGGGFLAWSLELVHQLARGSRPRESV